MELRLEGAQINLRKLKKSDAHSIHSHAKDYEIYRYTAVIPHPYRLKHALEFIPKTWKEMRANTGCALGMEDPNTGRIIGMISLMKIDAKSRNAELGYWLGKKHWGKGITSEAVRLILNFGFKKLGLRKVYARVMHPNRASARVLQKSGFRPEGTGRKHIFKDGRWYDELRFGLLKEEYQKTREKSKHSIR
jgi:RimJ/RimL family protein N-acetyltransferase